MSVRGCTLVLAAALVCGCASKPGSRAGGDSSSSSGGPAPAETSSGGDDSTSSGATPSSDSSTGTASASVVVHGHRGDRGNVPPGNTILSFRSALGYGVDVLEGDLQITQDGSVVFGHDDNLETTGCTWVGKGRPSSSRVSSMTDAELAQWDCHPEVDGIQSPPHLHEVIALDDAVGFNLELKRWGAEEADIYLPALIAEDDACGGCLAPRLIVQSFDWVGIEHVHDTYRPGFDIRLSLLAQIPRADEMEAARRFADIWSPRFDIATTETIATAHELGFEVAPWTVNDEAEMRRLVDAGADAIITDFPNLLIQVRGR